MKKILTQSFFNRPALTVAEELLGKFLVVQSKHGVSARMITEVEVYDGFDDKASHAHRGETKRNAVMFGEAGHWYVYLCYGMHWMLNIVTGEREYPAAVLIRGVEGADGPGKLTKALGIDRHFDGLLAAKRSGLWVEDRGVSVLPQYISRTPRIGVKYAGEEWMNKPYRFVLKRTGHI